MSERFRLSWRERVRLAWRILSSGVDERYETCLDCLMELSVPAFPKEADHA